MIFNSNHEATKLVDRKSPITWCARVAIALLLVTVLAWSGGVADAQADGTRTLYLIRHGDYDHEDPRDPEVGKALIELGRKQAALVGARLAALPVAMTAFYTSPMTRARQTAEIMSEHFPDLEVQMSRDLRECTPPTYRQDIMEQVDADEARECRDQFERAFRELFAPSAKEDTHEIVVFHGNAIRYLVSRAIGLDPKSWLAMAIGNCSITEVLVLADGSVRLISFSDVGHIPPAMQTLTGLGRRFAPQIEKKK